MSQMRVSSAIAECVTHSANKTMALCSLREIVRLLMNERDLVSPLREKARGAVIDKKTLFEILDRRKNPA